MREWGTGRLAKGLRVESYNVKNEKYEATIEVDRDEISDDQTGQIRIRLQELAARAATHKDFLIGQLLINGATAGFNSYDGVTFFNDAHVSGASGNQDNTLVAAAADSEDPTTAEFKTSLKAAIADLKRFAYLSDPKTWYLLKTDGIVRPFIFQNREELEWKTLEAGSDEEFMCEKYLYGVRARYRMTYGYWQHAIRNVFA